MERAEATTPSFSLYPLTLSSETLKKSIAAVSQWLQWVIAMDRTRHYLISRVFGRRKWYERAARVLGCSKTHVFDMNAGRKPISKRYRRILETYVDQRRRAISQAVARAMARAERIEREELKACVSADLDLRSLAAAEKRKDAK